MKTQFVEIAAVMKRPLAKSYDAINPYTAEGAIYYHFPMERRWSHELVKYEPTSRESTIVPLPNDINMYDSQIC